MNMGKIITNKNEHGNISSSLEYLSKLNLNKDLKILDIGCRFGSLIYNLYQMGYKNVYGIDLNEKSILKGKSVYPEIASHLSTAEKDRVNFEDDSIDVILMFDVIEHIPDPQNYLTENVFKILKRKGLFIFQTPNKYINVPWEIIKNRNLQSYKKYHCSLQSYKSLQRLLNDSNFCDVKIEKFNIITDHNIEKVKKKLGWIGLLLLKLTKIFPIQLYPNFWGYCFRK